MNAAQFSAVVSLATSDRDFTDVDDTSLHGCGLAGFQRVTATAETCAKFLRYHAMQFNSEWDAEALNECAEIFRHKVTLA